MAAFAGGAVLVLGLVGFGDLAIGAGRSRIFPKAGRSSQLVMAASLGEPPANDEFEQAVVLTDLPFSDSLATDGATRADDDPYDGGNESPTVWYALTPASSGLIRAHTFGSDTATALSVFTGLRGSLQEIVRNEQYGSGSDYGLDQPLVIFEATAGVTYHLMMGTEGGTLRVFVESLGPAAITPVPDSAVWAGGTTSGVLLLSPDESRLFTTRQDSTVAVFDVASDGRLTLASSSPTPGPTPTHMAINPAGDRLSVSAGLDINVHSVLPDGSLPLIGTGSLDEGGSFNSIVYVPLPGGDRLYVNDDVRGDANNTVVAFRVEEDGTLTSEIDYATGGAGGSGYYYASPGLRVAGRLLFALNGSIELGSNDISVFRIGDDGRLELVDGSPFPLPDPTQTSGAIAVAPDGDFLFAGTSDGRVVRYAVAADGSLVGATVFSIGGFLPVVHLEMHPDGTVLAATFESTNHLALIEPRSMAPFPGSPILAAAYRPSGLAFDRDGSRLFVGDLTGAVVYSTADLSSDHAPMVECAPLVLLHCAPNGVDRATLTVHVEDPEGDPLTVTWRVDGAVAQVDNVPAGTPSNLTLTTFYSIGDHTVEVSAADSRAESRCATTVRILDEMPPVLAVSLAISRLWPPGSDFVNVGLDASVLDCSLETRLDVEVFSDEDDAGREARGSGRGHPRRSLLASPDARASAPGTLELRAERNPRGDGRVYLIVTHATDAVGNTSVACSTAIVPQSSSATSTLAAQAQADAAQAFCLANVGAPPSGYFAIGEPRSASASSRPAP